MCPVANCNEEEYSSHPKEDLTLEKYVDYIAKYAEDGHTEDTRCLYLKDWHFVK